MLILSPRLRRRARVSGSAGDVWFLGSVAVDVACHVLVFLFVFEVDDEVGGF